MSGAATVNTNHSYRLHGLQSDDVRTLDVKEVISAHYKDTERLASSWSKSPYYLMRIAGWMIVERCLSVELHNSHIYPVSRGLTLLVPVISYTEA